MEIYGDSNALVVFFFQLVESFFFQLNPGGFMGGGGGRGKAVSGGRFPGKIGK